MLCVCGSVSIDQCVDTGLCVLRVHACARVRPRVSRVAVCVPAPPGVFVPDSGDRNQRSKQTEDKDILAECLVRRIVHNGRGVALVPLPRRKIY